MYKEVKSRLPEVWSKGYLHTRHNWNDPNSATSAITIRGLLKYLECVLDDHRDDELWEVSTTLNPRGSYGQRTSLKNYVHHPLEEDEQKAESVSAARNEMIATFNKGQEICTCCKKNHRLFECKEFPHLTYTQKIDILRAGKHCRGC